MLFINMYRRIIVWPLVIMFLLLQLTSCGINSTLNVRKESFGLLRVETSIKIRSCLRPERMCEQLEVIEAEQLLQSIGSAVIVDHKMRPRRTYLVSAWHVCDGGVVEEVKIYDAIYDVVSTVKIEVITPDGNSHEASVIKKDEKSDLCLLEVNKKIGKKVKLAAWPPDWGEKTYNIAAPYGVFNKDLTLIFEGRYSGHAWKSSFFTFPARPGSSGSPVFNSDGELISIIHSSSTLMENIAIGTTYQALREFLKD